MRVITLAVAGFSVLMAGLVPGYGAVSSLRAISGVENNAIFGANDGFDFKREARPYVLAQASDPRIIQLEEEIRNLNGRVEEMNFLLLEMQERLRKQQEDMDFRLQQLEEKRSDVGTSDASEPERISSVEPEIKPTPSVKPAPTVKPRVITLQEPRLSEFKLDQNGEVVGGEKNQLQNDAYQMAYQNILTGDYRDGEKDFRAFIKNYPASPRLADAHFWLGEALLGQEKFEEAAEVFLAATKQFPNVAKSPDMMLKLGISLSALRKQEIACATLAEVIKRYPNISSAMVQRVQTERQFAGC